MMQLIKNILLLLILAPFVAAFNPLRTNKYTRVSRLEMKITGRVKFFDPKKGFGFISPSDGSPDIFVHQSAIYAPGFRSLDDGEEVEFDIKEDFATGKKSAIDVTGPNGAYVKGRPQPPRQDRSNYGRY